MNTMNTIEGIPASQPYQVPPLPQYQLPPQQMFQQIPPQQPQPSVFIPPPPLSDTPRSTSNGGFDI